MHAKVYIVDDVHSLVTSANFTISGMEINTEAGVASKDKKEISDLIKEFGTWFSQATSLDRSWLEDEQQKLSAYKKEEPVEPKPPFNTTDYHSPEKDDNNNAGGKYRELPLPKDWEPLLDFLRKMKFQPILII